MPSGLLGHGAGNRCQDDHDPSEIVIDEVAGQWIALLPLAIWPLPFDSAAVYYLFGFVAFRIFDITKPGLVGWADRLVGPLGVMLDDVIAGVMAAAAMALVMVLCERSCRRNFA